MRLDQHPDFPDLISATGEALRAKGAPRIRDEHVEKDYWVTEVLRFCHAHLGDRALFKGGTSLSKGWGIIRRFSEDVDLAVSTVRDGKPMSKGQIRGDLSRLAKFIDGHEGLRRDEERKRVSEGARDEYYMYDRRFDGSLPPSVKLEVGTRSGQIPNVVRPIQSEVAKFIEECDINLTETEIPPPFSMRLMDRRRTFVEKLLAIHSEVERHLSGNRELTTTVRHYYDIHALAQIEEVRNFLGTNEHLEVKRDYEAICRAHFPSAVLPPEMSLKDSRALFPDDAIKNDLANRYETHIELLAFEDAPPSFGLVQAALEGLRDRL